MTCRKNMKPEIVTCKLSDFLKTYLHCPSDGLVESCLAKLEEAELVERVEGRSGSRLAFTKFCDSNHPKDVFFQPLEDICQILKSETSDNGDTARFLLCPDRELEGTKRKIDACIRFDEGEELNVWNAAVVFQLNTTDSQTNFCDNAIKAGSANAQIMWEDVRRLFTIGVTIERHTVSLFYHCRSHSAVSYAFNFVKSPKTFIKILLSFLRINRHQLGYDPLITRDADGSYIYQVPDGEGNPMFYRTVTLLHNAWPGFIRGPSSRVWKVIRVASATDPNPMPGSEPAILKDVWLDHDVMTEKQVQEAIWRDLHTSWASMEPARRDKIKEMYPNFDELISNGTYKHYFLKVEAELEGEMTVDIAPFREESLMWTVVYYSIRPGIWFPKLYSTEDTENIINEPDSETIREYRRKKRYFVVFEEVCTTVDNLEFLGEAMDVLRDSLLGLLFFYCAGWVHRDLSPANIMAYRINENEPWQAKICDLEYATKFKKVLGQDGTKLQVGTAYFAAVDVMRGSWSVAAERAAMEEVSTGTPAGKSPDEPKIPPFFASYQHDMESLWWIVVFIILVRLPSPRSLALARTIFRNSMELTTTRHYFLLFYSSKNLKDVLPAKVSFLASSLGQMGDTLGWLDVKLAKDRLWSEDSEYLPLYEIFHTMFHHLYLQDGWQQLRLDDVNVHDEGGATTTPSQGPSKKRPRDCDKPETADSGALSGNIPSTENTASSQSALEQSSCSAQTGLTNSPAPKRTRQTED